MMMKMRLGIRGIHVDPLDVPRYGGRLIFLYAIKTIHLQSRENLGFAGARPENFDARNRLRMAKPNFLPERRGAKTPTRSHIFEVVVFSCGVLNDDSDPSPNSRAIRSHTFEF